MKTLKLFTLLALAVLTSAVGWGNNVYVKVTHESQLMAGKKYILVSESQNTTTSGTTKNHVNVAGKFTTTFVRKYLSYNEGANPNNYVSNNIDAIDISSSSFTDACELTLSGSLDQCTLALPESYNTTSGETNYVARGTSETSNLMAQTIDATLDRAQWRIVDDGNGFVVYNNKDTDRLIAQTKYNTAFSCVKESTTGIYKAYLFVQAGESTIEATPSELALGKNPNGTFSVSGENLLKNVTISTSSTGFSVEPSSLVISDHAINNETITVSYSGTNANATGTIKVTSGATSIQVPVTAQAADGILEVSTETLDLGTNSSGTFTLNGSHLTNTSAKRVQLKVSESGFAVSPSSIIPVNGTIDNETITVSYNGMNTAATGTITIKATDAYGEVTKTVTVNAQAQTGTLEVSTETLDLGTNPSGTFIVNGKFLTEASIEIDKTNSDNGFSISPNRLPLASNALNDKEITVTYTGVKANATAYIIITATDAYGTTLTKTVTVTAQAQAGTLAVSPETLELGTNPSGTFTVSGTNLASHALITIDRDNSDNGFSLSKSDLSPSLHALKDEEIVVSYRGAKENATAQIIVTTTDAYSTLTKTITVTAQALLEVSSNTVALGTNPSGTFTVNAKNLGQNIIISMVENSDGRFDASPETITVADGVVENQEITVTYTGLSSEATATINVTSGEITRVVTITASAGPVAATGTSIYIDKTNLPTDAHIWAWDSKGDYFENWPGKPVSELETVTIGNDVEVYQFVYSHDDATTAGVIFNQGSNQNQTANIAPNNHEIFYYTGNGDYRLGVPIDEVIFPDEYFRFALGTYPMTKFDSNGDGVLHPDEIAEATSLKFGTDYFSPLRTEYAQYGLDEPGSPSDFTGIGYLYALNEVDLSGDVRNGVTPCPINSSYIDLSKNINLESIRVSAAPDLKILSLPETETLKELKVGDEGEGICRISVIDVSHNPNLEVLYIANSSTKPGRITSIDLSQNNKLKSLTIYNEPVTPLDLQANTALESLVLGNTAIETLDFTPLAQLKELSLSYNKQFTQDLVLNNQSELTRLSVRDQEYPEKIDLTNNKKVSYLVANELENLETLIIPSDLTTLEHLWIENNEKLKNHTFDLTNNLGLVQMSINFLGGGNVIKGVSNKMKELRYISTENQRYEGNILNLEGCTKLHHLDVMNCGLSALYLKNCTALGNKSAGNDNTQFFIPGNNLRSLDLTGVELPYNYNMSPRHEDDQWVPANSPFMPDDYMYHVSYNQQNTAALIDDLAPSVALVYHDRWAATPNYTYLVYVRLDKNENDKNREGKVVPTLNELFNQEACEKFDCDPDVVDVAFDYKRVKLWSRFTNTQEGPVLDVHGTKEIHAISGVEAPNWTEYPEQLDLSQVDPNYVLGNILSLGMYTVPCGHDRRYHETTGAEGTTADIEDAYVGGTVSYFYSTLEWSKGAQDGPAPMPKRANDNTGVDLDVYEPYNGDAINDGTAEVEYYKGLTVQDNAVVAQYDNTIPFNFDWEVMLNNKPEQIVTAIEHVHGDQVALIQEIQYYNTLGMMSHKPFEGVNIVVTRYSNGTTTTTKIVK